MSRLNFDYTLQHSDEESKIQEQELYTDSSDDITDNSAISLMDEISKEREILRLRSDMDQLNEQLMFYSQSIMDDGEPEPFTPVTGR